MSLSAWGAVDVLVSWHSVESVLIEKTSSSAKNKVWDLKFENFITICIWVKNGLLNKDIYYLSIIQLCLLRVC